MAEPSGGTGASTEDLLEQLRRLRVADVVLSTAATLAQLAYAKLDERSRDLEQARLAIDTLRALVPMLRGAVPDDAVRDLEQTLVNLQLAFASAAAARPPAPSPTGETQPPVDA